MSGMRFKCFGIVFFLFLLVPAVSFASDAPKPVTSTEWFAMNSDEKTAYILSEINSLDHRGVALSKSAEEYVSLIDEHESAAFLNSESDDPRASMPNIDELLFSIALAKEPRNREAMRQLKKK